MGIKEVGIEVVSATQRLKFLTSAKQLIFSE